MRLENDASDQKTNLLPGTNECTEVPERKPVTRPPLEADSRVSVDGRVPKFAVKMWV